MDEELCAADVELRIRGRLVRLMQRKQFRTNEVIAAQQIMWQIDGKMAVIRDQFLRAPLTRNLVVAVFPDLEPARSGGGVGGRVVDSLEIDGAWAFVRRVDAAVTGVVGPVAVFEGQGRG